MSDTKPTEKDALRAKIAKLEAELAEAKKADAEDEELRRLRDKAHLLEQELEHRRAMRRVQGWRGFNIAPMRRTLELRPGLFTSGYVRVVSEG